MLDNILSRDELKAFAREQAREKERRTVRRADVEALVAEGWTVRRNGSISVGLERPRRKSSALEARVWTMLFEMGFFQLSGRGGATLRSADDSSRLTSQIDAVAIDDEVALCCECKSFETAKRDGAFQEKLAKFGLLKKSFVTAVSKLSPRKGRRHTALLMFTWDILLSENDRERAQEQGIALFDIADLEYFEALARLLGPAARYQLLAEVFRHRKVAGLEIRVPALRMTAGATEYFTFAIRPDYLLKISYVAHRAKGKAIDVDAYQRLISKSRLKQIGAYISRDGTFPNNIVINIEDARHVRFERGKQEGDEVGAQFGWLTLSAAYGCAWIIDGQHRLFAYSGHPRAATSSLSVLAFAGLSPTRQAQLFVDINSEQRRVKRSLLVELDAILKWESEEPEKRIDAVVSKVALALDEFMESPLRGRVQPADVARTDTRCVSLNSLTAALNKPGLFIVGARKGVKEFGPLWREDPSHCLKRTLLIVSAWLSEVARAAADWWAIGSGPGGGLAMNNGVTVVLNVLRSVLEHLNQRSSLLLASDADVVERLRPYAKALGDHLATLSPEGRKSFRELQGVNGQTTGTRLCQEALTREFPNFSPPGLAEWIAARKADTNAEARQLVEEIEHALQDYVLDRLKEEFNADPQDWWYEGVPLAIRQRIQTRIEETKGDAGAREKNFDLINYRDIATKNWNLFAAALGFGKRGSKIDRTAWLVEVSQIRNVVMHPSRREYVAVERLHTLRSYRDTLLRQIALAESQPREKLDSALDAGETTDE